MMAGGLAMSDSKEGMGSLPEGGEQGAPGPVGEAAAGRLARGIGKRDLAIRQEELQATGREFLADRTMQVEY